MHKRIKILLLFILSSYFLSAQNISDKEINYFQSQEAELKTVLKSAIVSDALVDRLKNDSSFIRGFIQILKNKNSFFYPFDSLRGMAVLYAPDSLFRVMTWAIKINDNYYRKQGALQMNTKDGSLKIFPLYDYSPFTERPFDSVRSTKTWIGAVYYDIVKTEFNGKNFYTLIGRDENNIVSTKKWIEVLYFDAQNQPVFGGNFFNIPDAPIQMQTAARYFVAYNKDASVTMKYNPEKKIILIDKLVSMSNQPDMPSTMVPDGEYCGFVWKSGKWQYIPKLFDDVPINQPTDILHGNAPREDPILDNDGNIDEKKLEKFSEQNKAKERK